MKPKDNDLHVDWIRKYDVLTKRAVGPKIYVAVCKCGSKKLLKAELGIRCMECGAFHSFDSFKKVLEKAKKMACGNPVEKRILTVINNSFSKLHDKLVEKGIIKKKTIV